MLLDELEITLKPLFEAALSGDEGAYRTFLQRVSGLLRNYVARQLSRGGRTHGSETEDVLQETLLAIHLSQHTYDGRSPITAWIFAIARYKAIDRLRRNGRERLVADIGEPVDAGAEFATSGVESQIDLDTLLSTLPVRTRLLVQQVKLQGYSVAEAARAADMTETAARVAIHRALQLLSRSLSTRVLKASDASVPLEENVTTRPRKANRSRVW